MKLIKTLVVTSLLLAPLAYAETLPAETNAAKQMDVPDKYFHATDTSKVVGMLIDELVRRANSRLNESQISEQDRPMHAQRILAVIKGDIGQGDYKTSVKNVFKKFLTEAEMTDIVDFYNSKSGQKLKQVQQSMNAEVYSTTVDWLDIVSQKIDALY